MVMNKKGQELTLGTIIVIVLGILVLVFLIYGFSVGWNNLWGKLPFSSSNIDDVRRSCNSDCELQNQYSFCEEAKTVNYGKKVNVGGVEIKSNKGSCQEMIENPGNFPEVNIESCPNLC